MNTQNPQYIKFLLAESFAAHEESFSVGASSDGKAVSTLIDIAEELEITEGIDWKGESEEREIEKFIARRLQVTGKAEISFERLTALNTNENLLSECSGVSGRFVREQFAVVGDELAKVGLTLVFLNDGEAVYRPFIIGSNEYESLEVELPPLDLPFLCSYQDLEKFNPATGFPTKKSIAARKKAESSLFNKVVRKLFG